MYILGLINVYNVILYMVWMVKNRKIFPREDYLKDTILKLNAVKGVKLLSKDEKRIDSIIEEIEERIECDGTFVYSVQKNILYNFFDTDMSLGEYLSQCKYNIYLTPENGAKISEITLPSKAKNIGMDFKNASLFFEYKKIKFKVVTGFKYNSDKK